MNSPTRVHCSECQASILQATALRTGGKCMPCHTGIRKYRREFTADELLAMCVDVRVGERQDRHWR